jgi:hypothetical protein
MCEGGIKWNSSGLHQINTKLYNLLALAFIVITLVHTQLNVVFLQNKHWPPNLKYTLCFTASHEWHTNWNTEKGYWDRHRPYIM